MTNAAAIERILQVHTRYRQPGGEDRAVEAERQLLEASGVEVRQVTFDNADLRESRSLAGDIQLAASAVWSPAARRRVATAIREHRPQVVHVHNTFAAASPSVLAAGRGLGVATVHTLHNYRLVCPAATLFRDGHPCVDCVGAPIPGPAVIHACVRGSRSQSLVAATTVGVHRQLGTYSRRIDAFILLTEFQRRLLVDAGLPGDRSHLVPNFLEPDPGAGTGDRSGVLFVGRLSIEKGIEPLLAAAAADPGHLLVAGGGPLANRVEEAASLGHVAYLGALPADAVVGRMRSARAVVVPSLWYEGFPMVVLEAFAAGTPVIASRIGSLAEVIEDGVTGFHVEPGDDGDLARMIRWVTDHPLETSAIGVNARRRFEERYRGSRHLAALLDVYERAAARRTKPR